MQYIYYTFYFLFLFSYTLHNIKESQNTHFFKYILEIFIYFFLLHIEFHQGSSIYISLACCISETWEYYHHEQKKKILKFFILQPATIKTIRARQSTSPLLLYSLYSKIWRKSKRVARVLPYELPKKKARGCCNIASAWALNWHQPCIITT